MKLRIESDGTAAGTRLLSEDGQAIEGVQSIFWSCQLGELASAHVRFHRMPAAFRVDSERLLVRERDPEHRIMREELDDRSLAEDLYRQERADRAREEEEQR